MTEYYNPENLRRFFTRSDEMDAASEAERYAAGVRLIAEVFRAMRQRHPASAPVIDACETAEHPLAALWRDPTWGTPAKALMVDMGLLLPLPPHIAQAFRDDEED